MQVSINFRKLEGFSMYINSTEYVLGKILLTALFIKNYLNKPSIYLVDTIYENMKTTLKQHLKTIANNFKT